MFESPNTQPLQLQQNHRRQFVGSSKTMFKSPNTHPLQLQQDHRCQFVGSSKRMFKTPITQPRTLRQHHGHQFVGSRKRMFKPPNTQPRLLQQRHHRVQERPETIAPKPSAKVARRCSNLQTLDLYGCSKITSACKNTLRQSHPKLQLR